MLSEQHEFCPNWLKNSGTVISQSTVKFDFLALCPLSTMIDYIFLMNKDENAVGSI